MEVSFFVVAESKYHAPAMPVIESRGKNFLLIFPPGDVPGGRRYYISGPENQPIVLKYRGIP